MTVCIASIFRWNYANAGEPVISGFAALAISDRMITAGDVQYEPQQLKVAFVAERTVILVAGNYSVHSLALADVFRQLRTNPTAAPLNIARMVGAAFQAIRQKRAEDIYLAPFGLNADTFLAQQREMSDGFVNRITDQIQSHEDDEVEAIVVGSEDERMHIYTVDPKGTVDCFDDVGFAAIGIGGWHARSHLMQWGYTNSVTYFPALAATYAAKKSAEVAPGVGRATDMHLLLHNDSPKPVHAATAAKVEELYDEFVTQQTEQQVAAIKRLADWAAEESKRNDEQETGDGKNATVDEGTVAPAAEAAQRDEIKEAD